jgi:RHS repeat-associated protein
MKVLQHIFGCLALTGGIFSAALAHAASTITYYHNDLLGSPVAATDASAHVIWRESYRPYGERLTNDPASTGNDVWYTSRRQDVDTGLVYMGARYYDPVAGRFVSKDPVGFDEGNIQSFNRYAYANDNPYKYVDQDGREPGDAYQRGYWVPVPQFSAEPGLENVCVECLALAATRIVPVIEAFSSVAATQGLSAAEHLAANRTAGSAFEQAVQDSLEQKGLTVGEQITIETRSGVRTRLDLLTQDPVTGEIGCIECKASSTARLTQNQARGFPEIGESGGTIKGAGKPGFPGGMEIPPTAVQVIRGP